MHYKTRQMEAEYAFRQEVLERTGMVILETKHAPTTELRMLPSASTAPAPEPPALDVDVTPALPESEAALDETVRGMQCRPGSIPKGISGVDGFGSRFQQPSTPGISLRPPLTPAVRIHFRQRRRP